MKRPVFQITLAHGMDYTGSQTLQTLTLIDTTSIMKA